MRADNTRRRMRERLMVDRHPCVHDLLERGAILVAVAELEPRVRRAGNIDVLVVGESIKLPRKCVLADRLERPRGCVHEQLQGRQALLAIDDAARLQIAKDRLLRLDHDRTQKVPGIPGRLQEPELR